MLLIYTITGVFTAEVLLVWSASMQDDIYLHILFYDTWQLLHKQKAPEDIVSKQFLFCL